MSSSIPKPGDRLAFRFRRHGIVAVTVKGVSTKQRTVWAQDDKGNMFTINFEDLHTREFFQDVF